MLRPAKGLRLIPRRGIVASDSDPESAARPLSTGGSGQGNGRHDGPAHSDAQEERSFEEVAVFNSWPRARRLRGDVLYRHLLALADVLSAALALYLDAMVLGEDRLTLLVLLIIPLVLLVGKIVGLYDRDEHLLHKTTLDEAPAVFQVATLYTLLVYLAGDGFIDVKYAFGRDQLLALWVLLFVLMLLARALARRIARMCVQEERCLVLGDWSAADWVQGKLESTHSVKARLVGRVPFGDASVPGTDQFLLGPFDRLGPILTEHRINRVVIAPEAAEVDEVLEAMRVVRSVGVKVSVLPRLVEVISSSGEFDQFTGVTLLGIRGHGLGRSSIALKRSMDIVGAGIMLVVLTPLFLVVSIAIKLGSPGPVLFRQKRIGREDKEFEMLKFRTMVEDAEAQKADLLGSNEADGLFKIVDDPRITKVGRVLRRSSLDELPQLLNVLRGEMSLVGPRPLILEEDRQVEGWARRRLVLAPGMTGLWQIFGSARIPLHEMVKIDYLYGANWSLWLDVKVLLRTVPYVLSRRGI